MDFCSDAETELSSALPGNSVDASDADTVSNYEKERALELINLYRGPDKKLKLQLKYDALATVLETCGDRPISVITTTGDIRSGKSLTANVIRQHLLDHETGATAARKKNKSFKGFPFKHGYKTVTKGIWIWSRAFIMDSSDGNEVAVLLLDTEGIDDEFSKPDEVTALLALSLLISSVTVMNSLGDLSTSCLKWLSKLGIKEQSLFQKVSFLVKDWTKTLYFKHGVAGGKKYLQKVVNQSKSRYSFLQSSENSVIECCLLPHAGETSMTSGFKGMSTDLNPYFRQHVQKYLKNLLCPEMISPKRIFGKELYAKEFEYFLRAYIDMLEANFHQNVTAELLGEQTREIAKQFKLREAGDEYQMQMSKGLNNAVGGYLDEESFEDLHEKAMKHALKKFQRIILDHQDDEKRVKQELIQNLEHKLEEFKEKNESSRKSETTASLNTAISSFKQQLSTKFPFKPYTNNFPPNLVFYQQELIEEVIAALKEAVTQDFFDEYPVNDTQEKQTLTSNLLEAFCELANELLSTNTANQRRAIENVSGHIHGLVAKYESNLTKKTEKLPNIDTDVLEQFHETEVENVEEKWKLLQLGSPEFHAEWYNTLTKHLKEAYKNIKLNLRSTMAKAMEVVDKDVSTYTDALIEKTRTLKAEELLLFHQSSVESILTHFKNPFPANSVQAREIQKTLQGHLENVYLKYAQDIVMAEQMAVTTAQLITECQTEYETKMKALSLNEYESLEDLTADHDARKAATLQKFQKTCPCQNEAFVAEWLPKLEVSIDSFYKELEILFVKMRKAEDQDFYQALFQARQNYVENMEQHFANNTKSYFGVDELEQANINVQNSVINKVNTDNQFTDKQLSTLRKELVKLYGKFDDKNVLNKKSFDESDPAIGIDLGTTYCCVAVYQNGEAKVIPSSNNGVNTTPSYVQINQVDAENDNVMVGHRAKALAFRNPGNTIFDAKRIIGRRLDDNKLQEDMKFWPFTVEDVDGFAKIRIGEKYYHPEEISSMVLSHLKRDAESYLGRPVKKAVITVPAYFTDGQRQATINAGKRAGLEVLAILNEPTAAAVAYRLTCFVPGTSKKILVYDLGGGTFDVAILEMTQDKINVLSVGGNSHLGGEDFDKNLMTYCAKEFETLHAEEDLSLFAEKDSTNQVKREKARRRLKRVQMQCEDAKKSLSISPIETVSLEEIFPGVDMEMHIKREKFYELNLSIFESTLETVDDAIAAAKLKKEDIDDIVMVGGSTRILKLQAMIENHFSGKKLMKKLNPDEAVAIGAAIQAAMLNAKPGEKIFDFGRILEVTPMSLGLAIANGDMDVLIPRGTKIPTEHTEEYRTHQVGQSVVTIRIYQGDKPKARENELLGNFKMELPVNNSGKEIVDVTMKINLNGILQVEAICRSNGQKCCITVCEGASGLSEEKDNRRALPGE